MNLNCGTPPGNVNDELDFVDNDIKEAFLGKSHYFTGTPTLVQLCRELRLLREALTSKSTTDTITK